MVTDLETPPPIETRAHKNVASLADLKLHQSAIEPSSKAMAWNMGNNVIAEKKQSVEPNPSQKIIRRHLPNEC
jgi:hypothetical protein